MRTVPWMIILAVCLAPLSAEGQAESTIAHVEGTGERKTPESESWLAAAKDDPVSKGDSLRTGPASSMYVILDPLSSFRINEQTTVEVASLAEESKLPDGTVEKLMNINLLKGDMVTKLKKLPKETRFTVTGPVAVAGALGTVFEMSVAGDGETTSVAVMESSASVTSLGEPNKSTTVGTFQRVEAAPWKIAAIRATGMGVLSEKILGKEKIEEAAAAVEIAGSASVAPDMAITDTKQRAAAAEEKAGSLARSKLYRDICSMKIDQQSSVRDRLLEEPGRCERLMEAIRKAKAEISTDESGARATVIITLKEVESAIGAKIAGIRMTVKEIHEEEYSKQYKAMARVTTKRAAKVDAYRRLAERIYGTVIDTKTTMKDFAIKDDRITTTVEGIVQGAQELAWRYYSDGSVAVDLEAPGAQVEAEVTKVAGNVLGTNYLSAPDIIEVSNFDELRKIMGN